MAPVAALALLALLAVCTGSTAAGEASDTASRGPDNIVTGTIKFADVGIAYKLYDIVKPGDEPKDIPTAVFLHGQKYTMDNWVELGTLAKVREAGVRALAIDLPGFGKTPALPYSDNNMRSELLKTVLTFAQTKPNSTLHLITPSMSGRYAVPFLDRHGTFITSWVALAPVGVSAWGGPWEDTHNKVCMLAVYGENDPLKKDLPILAKVFKNAFQAVLPGAGHACYLDKPEEFHRLLLQFLKKCRRGDKGEHLLKSDAEVKVEM